MSTEGSSLLYTVLTSAALHCRLRLWRLLCQSTAHSWATGVAHLPQHTTAYEHLPCIRLLPVIQIFKLCAAVPESAGPCGLPGIWLPHVGDCQHLGWRRLASVKAALQVSDLNSCPLDLPAAALLHGHTLVCCNHEVLQKQSSQNLMPGVHPIPLLFARAGGSVGNSAQTVCCQAGSGCVQSNAVSVSLCMEAGTLASNSMTACCGEHQGSLGRLVV